MRKFCGESRRFVETVIFHCKSEQQVLQKLAEKTNPRKNCAEKQHILAREIPCAGGEIRGIAAPGTRGAPRPSLGQSRATNNPLRHGITTLCYNKSYTCSTLFSRAFLSNKPLHSHRFSKLLKCHPRLSRVMILTY